MTPEQFKTAKPQFQDVPDATVQSYIDMAAEFVPATDDNATILMTCHLMTLDGLGTDAASETHRTGTAEYQSIRSGNLTLTRYAKSASEAGYSFMEWMASTPCGRQLYLILKRKRGGPRVASGRVGRVASGYALDWPFPGVYPW